MSFRADTERLVLKKARQLDVSARNLLTEPQLADSPVTDPARRIFPMIVCGGQYPINPVTVSYIEQIASEVTAMGITVRHPDAPETATRRQQCLTAAPGP